MECSNMSAITVYATDEFVSWLCKVEPRNVFKNAKEFNFHPNVYMCDPEDPNLWGRCFRDNFRAIFINEIDGVVLAGELWEGLLNYDLFKKWFTFEYHDAVLKFPGKEIEFYSE